jgi:hypothetical protein
MVSTNRQRCKPSLSLLQAMGRWRWRPGKRERERWSAARWDEQQQQSTATAIQRLGIKKTQGGLVIQIQRLGIKKTQGGLVCGCGPGIRQQLFPSSLLRLPGINKTQIQRLGINKTQGGLVVQIQCLGINVKLWTWGAPLMYVVFACPMTSSAPRGSKGFFYLFGGGAFANPTGHPHHQVNIIQAFGVLGATRSPPPIKTPVWGFFPVSHSGDEFFPVNRSFIWDLGGFFLVSQSGEEFLPINRSFFWGLGGFFPVSHSFEGFYPINRGFNLYGGGRPTGATAGGGGIRMLQHTAKMSLVARCTPRLASHNASLAL